MLEDSIKKLENFVDNSLNFPFEYENKIFFVDICIDLPLVLNQIHEVLFYVSRNHPVDLSYWNILSMKIQSYSNTLSLCVLDAEISDHASVIQNIPTETPVRKTLVS